MKKISPNEIKEIIQSGHLNFLIGSGCSQPYLSVLKDIEEKMNVEATREQAQKDYYEIIKKSKSIFDASLEADVAEQPKLETVKKNYDSFVGSLVSILSRRRLQIVNKQANIFTTNFDMFVEDACERLGVPYNDGFSGQIKRTFSVANFNKIQKYKSLQFDNTSDIPLLNIIKLHGSVSWKSDDTCSTISYSDGSHIPDNLGTKTGARFKKGYKNIAVINPNAEKHFETVLDTNYAAMLRKFTLELEKENSVLVIVGCSLADKHIKELLYGVMKSNPTLVVLYFTYSKYDEVADLLKEQENKNLYILSPESAEAAEKQSFDKSTIRLFDLKIAEEVEEENNENTH